MQQLMICALPAFFVVSCQIKSSEVEIPRGDRASASVARLVHSCVRPGGEQEITIRAEPGVAIAYQAIYSDGKNGLSPGYYGGNKAGATDENGVWRDTWQVGQGAPPGPVKVDVVGAESRRMATVRFEIADSSGHCR